MTTTTPSVFQPLLPDDPREVGGYQLHARLGAGGMGRVYLSYTPGGRPVALKVVRPEFAEDAEFRRRFAREVANARRIDGLHTAQVIDSGTDAETPWLVTAYVPGPSLQQVVREHGALPVRTVLLLMAGIAEALQAIHDVGVVHRDLKPANVLVAGDGPRVIDFGIALAADATVLTGTGIRIGSPAFMAPEQAQGGAVTPATDVFALGALAAYVAGGAPPFGEGPESAALYRLVHEDPDLGPVPGELHPLLLRCLAKRPQERPTPAEIIEAARSHPSAGGRLRFADDWLPAPVSTEIGRRSELPEAPTAPLRTALATALASVPEAGATPEAGAKRRRPSWKILVPLAVAVVLGSTAGVVALVDHYGRSGADPAAYTAVYTEAQLTSPDGTYDFDLEAGKVAPADSAGWHLGHGADEFRIPAESDAFIAEDGRLTPAECADGIDRQPVSALGFDALPPGRSFCVRSRKTHDIAVVLVVSAAADDGPAEISVDYYLTNT